MQNLITWVIVQNKMVGAIVKIQKEPQGAFVRETGREERLGGKRSSAPTFKNIGVVRN